MTETTVDPAASPGTPGAPVRGPSTGRHHPRDTPRRLRFRLAVVGLVIVGAVVFLLVEGLGSSLDYFETVPQAQASRASLGTSNFRLEGTVVPGSVNRTAVGTNFSVSQGGQTVAVVNTGTPPQLFQPNIPVVVVGHFSSPTSDTFFSNQIMVKHSANYIAKHPQRVRASGGAVH